MPQNLPALSVIIVTPDRYETIRKTMGLLMVQTAREQLEVVIVAPAEDVLIDALTHVDGALRVRVVAVGRVVTVGEANAAGVRVAHAPLVAFVEEHSYPEPGWAQAFIRAHTQPWAVVGPVARNANPGSLVSWADFALFYGPWAEGHAAGPVAHLPGHNSSYKRDLLLNYGKELGALLGAESVLQWDLRAQGHKLYLEPAARMAHVNFGLPRPWLTVLFHASRLFAAVRALRWPVWRKALYVLGTPLIPAVRLVRMVREQRRIHPQQRPPWLAWPLIALGLALSACGELLGYLTGAGRASERMSALESHRLHYTREGRASRGV